MPEYQNLDLNSLIDLLSQMTSTYMNLIKENGFSEKSDQCKKEILEIQASIETRKRFDKKLSGDKGNNLRQDSIATTTRE